MNWNKRKALNQIYKRLFDVYGKQKWWPAKTKFEVIVGAILTQNTNWVNVEKALDNIRAEGLLRFKALDSIAIEKLALLIKPAGYYNIKAKRLKNFIGFFSSEYQGSLKKMGSEKPDILREKLLRVNGIGPETADSILLYAIDVPIFVVDAYTKRIFSRHGLVKQEDDYYVIQKFFMDNLERNGKVFNEYHALIVKLAKEHCRVKPQCEKCPLIGLNGFEKLN
ncbi:MAG: endonuclease III domain-containing protein [Candidatus Omnitrophica bacterium]|nr:endonuclease III domain-containing protein [Candidatus Omnitrophota bacterium]MBU1996570.1 endonuclease III domain-containing protein [Candidatus Omnitrophota bacterium]MBU4334104.1 endonuclease III domain-containing protein [Candidatus Omnitrophota bacterium]